MLKHYPTAEEYSATMGKLWSVVRGYCSDDEEACNTISMAVENAFYDMRQGSSEYRAWNRACEDMYVESDYAMELCECVYALGLEEEIDDEDDNEEYCQRDDVQELLDFVFSQL